MVSAAVVSSAADEAEESAEASVTLFTAVSSSFPAELQPLIADMITAAAAVSAAVFKAFDLNMVTDLSDRGQIIRLLPVISAG